MNEKENPNDSKQKRLSFDSWLETLELREEKVPCEECVGGKVDCDGSGEVECEKCPGTGLIGDCVWCGDEGGYPDNYPGAESTGWVVCDHCHGDPNIKCACGGKVTVDCEEPGRDDGKVECVDCEGAGTVIEYSPENSMRFEELRTLGICLFNYEDQVCEYSDLHLEYVRVVTEEDRLINARKLERPLA